MQNEIISPSSPDHFSGSSPACASPAGAGVFPPICAAYPSCAERGTPAQCCEDLAESGPCQRCEICGAPGEYVRLGTADRPASKRRCAAHREAEPVTGQPLFAEAP